MPVAPLLDFQSMGCQRRAERALAMEFFTRGLLLRSAGL
ncbi:Unknown protein sequence [Pseudomonas syringae pv. maculicola]|nr:Unknown protein sequence [Pseudomonas syringae pv. maculicola]